MSGYDLAAWPLFRSVIDDGPGPDKPKRCFVISPADPDQPDLQRHVDAVWKYIIRPAALDGEFGVHRVEEARTDTTQTVVDHILDDDLVLAILSRPHPNVFYETAIAQAAGRPLIVLIEEDRPLRIDPRGAVVVRYSLDTDAVFSGENVRRLQAAFVEASGRGELTQGFRPGASPLNAGGAPGARVIERSRLFRYDQRLDMIRAAGRRIDIMGVANLALALHPDAVEAFRACAGRGMEVRILQCAPGNPGLLSLFGARSGDALAAVKSEIEAAAEAWRRIIEGVGGDISISMRRQQQVVPLASALITDRAVIATPYLASLPTSESPAMHAPAGSGYHAVIQAEFDGMWSDAASLLRSDGAAVADRTNPSYMIDATRPPPLHPQPSAGGAVRGLASIRGPGPFNF